MTGTGKPSKLAIIHYHPLEWYPPVMNLIDYFAEHTPSLRVKVLTNAGKAAELQTFSVKAGHISIVRLNSAVHWKGRLRVLKYLNFYLQTLVRLFLLRPDAVLYFESISSWPALVYKRIRGSRVRLMVHYHEYVTPAEYDSGMRMVKLMHQTEQRLYPNGFYWISQTNEVRMQKFLADNNLTYSEAVHHIMPNYPTIKWLRKAPGTITNRKVRLVYVGSLGYNNMYFQELVDWVGRQEHFTLDIYAYNMDERVRSLLTKGGLPNVNFKGGCSYQMLPDVLSQYDVGLVIYKPYSENTVHAVSNKVFEYLACGLDVWYSKEMTYTDRYQTSKSYPRVLAVDFSSLDEFNFSEALCRDGLAFTPPAYCYENVYPHLASRLKPEGSA